MADAWGAQQRRGLAVAATALAMCLAGCTGQTEAPTEPAPTNDANLVIAEMLAAAPDDISAEQRSALEAAVTSGEITFEVYQEAVLATIDCVKALGFSVDGPRADETRGLPALTWGFQAPSEVDATDADAMAIDCQIENSSYIEMAYSGQPIAMQSEEQLLEQWRPQLIACLESYGVEPMVDGSIYDLVNQAVELNEPNDYSGPDCVDEVGMHG